MLGVKFPFYEFSKKELKELNDKTFMPEWVDVTNYQHVFQKPSCVKDPKGKLWGLEECLAIASQPLVFGDKKQIQAFKALDFFNYLYNKRSNV